VGSDVYKRQVASYMKILHMNVQTSNKF
jgi:hypothetical protein